MMNQDVIINRVLRDMKMAGLITTDESGDIRSGEARVYLNMLYVAAWESRKKEYNQVQEKEVIQEDKNHNEIQTHKSMADARKKVGMSKAGMIEAIKHNKLTRKGYYFRYVEFKNVG